MNIGKGEKYEKKSKIAPKKLKPIVKILEVTPSIKEFNIAFKGMVRPKFYY
ncbi:hypothetical protein OAE09_05045 [Alphaproteobacteria bacterium]|jgi:hypothetical protein|nr:hypothetical protein [Alphaproteobacteria bacterium]